MTQMGRGTGTDLLVEHNKDHNVGRVLGSYARRDGALVVGGVIRDEDTARRVRSGELRGLSLGTVVTSVEEGSRKDCIRSQEELSLCTEPRRMGCYIDTLDGKTVRTACNFSGRREGPCASRVCNKRATSTCRYPIPLNNDIAW
jgi:hypothetical protein